MILLDTHCALWLEVTPEEFSLKARARLQEAERSAEKLAISCVTLWEIALKNTRGQLELTLPCAQFLAELERDFTVLPIDREVAIRAATLPAAFPRDPMDRLIAGTALAHDLTLITADGNIRGANACRWLW